jgi:ditrans,polycis-polyprenyl diphosphate synthase
VSVYAFALDNFKRPPEEVAALMELAETRLVELCEHGYVFDLSYSQQLNLASDRDLLDKHGVRLNIIGRKELFPESVQKAMARAEGLTRHNKRYGSSIWALL